MSTAGKRRPPPYVLDALAHLARSGERRMPTARFEMMLTGVEWPRQTIQRTILALERRGWINIYGGMMVVTDDGHAAAPVGDTSVGRPLRSFTTRSGASRALPRVESTSNHQRSSWPT